MVPEIDRARRLMEPTKRVVHDLEGQAGETAPLSSAGTLDFGVLARK